jgi:class 3 adenylate cyclase
MVTDDQVLPAIKEIIGDARSLYKKTVSVTQRNAIPDTNDIPIENLLYWLKIPDVICVFVDMKGSTNLSAVKHDNSTARAYQYYTGTAVRIFSEFEAPYIDVRGDGALALFDQDQPHRALAAAVSFKTFAYEEFRQDVKKTTELEIGSHAGIDMRTVLVRKIGFKRYRGRSDRQNEVWAGKPVNMAAKLAALSDDNELLVSKRFFDKLTSDRAIWSCGCGSADGKSSRLWTEYDLSDKEQFDFDSAYRLGSNWCKTHGQGYCSEMLKADG